MNSNAKSPALESGAAANAVLPSLHFQFLDGARGVAILAVLLFHCIGVSFGRDQLSWNGWLRDFTASRSLLALLPISYGWVGVPIFFVVSGFCIHWSFLKSTPGIEAHAQPSKIHSKFQWRSFFLRRFFRIYPRYLLTLLFFRRFSNHATGV